MGGFTSKYPNFIKGVLRVDPVPRNFYFSNGLISKYKFAIKKAESEPSAQIYKEFNPAIVDVAYQWLGFEQSKKELFELGGINNEIPVIILSSLKMNKTHPIEGDWNIQQRQWLNGNPKSKIVIINSGHFIQLENPNIVCDQIKELLKIK